MSPEPPRYVLTASCGDVAGILAAVSGHLAEHGAFILESKQFGDPQSNRFFLRLVFRKPAGEARSVDVLRESFSEVACRFGMDWEIVDTAARPRVLIAVSRFGHCLNDLLHRWSIGVLPVEIVGVFSNHCDMRSLTEWHGIPFHFLPEAPESKHDQESRILALVKDLRIDFVVLARYMQVLSPELCQALAWHCINIHHSFLPSFKGARPYHQAHRRGVKIIGATAHYVTTDLDEGPIIEQDVERVDHEHASSELVNIGRDIEARVLARAVRWHAERRVLPNGQRTVVFR